MRLLKPNCPFRLISIVFLSLFFAASTSMWTVHIYSNGSHFWRLPAPSEKHNDNKKIGAKAAVASLLNVQFAPFALGMSEPVSFDLEEDRQAFLALAPTSVQSNPALFPSDLRGPRWRLPFRYACKLFVQYQSFLL